MKKLTIKICDVVSEQLICILNTEMLVAPVKGATIIFADESNTHIKKYAGIIHDIIFHYQNIDDYIQLEVKDIQLVNIIKKGF